MDFIAKIFGGLKKKAQGGGIVAVFASVIGIAVVLLIVGIFLAYDAQIVGDVQDDFVTQTTGCGLNSSGGTTGTLLYDQCKAGYNITQESLDATKNLSTKQKTITNIAIAVVIISMLLIVAGIVGISMRG